MQNISRQFLDSSAENLRALQNQISESENLSDALLNEVFRTLHTIKGTAQALGFEASSRFAHQLENLLSDAKNGQKAPDKILLSDGLKALTQTLIEKDFIIPSHITEKLGVFIPDNSVADISVSELPSKISNHLSAQEKKAIASALKNGENLYCLEAGFELKSFTIGLKTLREDLNRNGNVIAVFAGEKPESEISFRVLFSGKSEAKVIEKLARKFSAEIVFQKNVSNNLSSDLQTVLAQIETHGKELAHKLGKEIRFETSFENINLSPENLKIVFESLLHLVRNAVDHAIEVPADRLAKGKNAQGTIKINLNSTENNLILAIEDDGSGVDLKKIRGLARERNLVPANQVLSEQDALELIFLPEFSTAENVSEISGRGVGLDAVKEMIENAGGEINIKSQKDAGTKFEISLPTADLIIDES